MTHKRTYLFVGTLLVTAIVITAVSLIRWTKWEYDENRIDLLVNSILADPTPQKIKQLLDYPENHYVDGEFAIHYTACLWLISEKRPGILDEFRASQTTPFLSESATSGRAAFEDYYPKGRK